MGRRKSRIQPEEQALFREAMQDVRPLACDRVLHPRQQPRPLPRSRLADEQEVMQELAHGLWDPLELESGEELLFARPGLQHGVLRKLRRGHYSVEAELDLHGLTSHEAREVLAEFLHICGRRGVRCARIIHGKGNGSVQRIPVLKAKVSHWLRQRDEVLAFASARPTDGGTGALYVLLRSTAGWG